ncbi:hypothetical protein QBC32DRAFT_160972 [Pseudoneurospora amorphoporcata]|uniref:C2H2-type domain-containing protein n=1 Tax=Pseudoneurospora amorphoporcata TaxID=241081 RepID=A0AAN6NT37_9PEZI|nr:hypothetical protein QBC32DRAFT_160972 [Pseudoneurospora amorphoporcata]
MNQQQLRCASSEMLSGEALWAWGDEQWEWTDGSLWSLPGGLGEVDFCLFNENPSISQAQALMLPSGTFQQTSRTIEPTIDPYLTLEVFNNLPANLPTYEQQAHFFPSGSPTYSQSPSLRFSPIPSQDSPSSVGFLETPPSMPLPYMPLNHRNASANGLQLQNLQAPAVFTNAMPGLPVVLMDGPLPEDAQAHPESSYEQAQNDPTPTDHSGHSPKLSARHRRRKEKPIKCSICAKGHAYQAELDRHIVAQHKDQAEEYALSVKRFPCPHCPMDFARKDGLVRHGQRTHGLAKQVKRRSNKN